MVNGKRDDLLDVANLTFGMLISASTEAGYKAISLVVIPRKKV